MEYTFALYAHGHVAGIETVIASSEREALDKMLHLDHDLPCEQWGETIEVHLINVEPTLSYPGVPTNCQVCKSRPTRMVINTPWDLQNPFLFICDVPALPKPGVDYKWQCLQTYAKENDNKTFDMPPALMEYSASKWAMLMIQSKTVY